MGSTDRMKGQTMKHIMFTAMVSLWATNAIAHSPLEATVPANEATVSKTPSEIVLDFKGAIRLTRVSMTQGNQPSVSLDLDAFSGFASDYALPVPPIGMGNYLIEWRGLGADGHPLKGSFSFTVK